MEVIFINLTEQFHDMLESIWKTDDSKMAVVNLFDDFK